MAPKAKTAKTLKAVRAMKRLGYSEKIVRPVLKELLKLYDDNWMLIEDESYQVLIDAILQSEDQKERSSEIEQLNARSEDEAEEIEPLLKRRKRGSQKDQSSPWLHASNPSASNEVENQPQGKQKMIESTFGKHQYKGIELKEPYVVKQEKGTNFVLHDEKDESTSLVPFVHLENSGDESESHNDFSEKMLITYERGNRNCFCDKLHDEDLSLAGIAFDKHLHEVASAIEPSSYDLPAFEVPPDSPKLLMGGSSYISCSDAKEEDSKFPDKIDLDADDDISPCLLVKDAYSVGNSSCMEGNHSEPINNENTEAEKNEYDVRDSLNLDIASSSRGEVKISLIVNSSVRSDFHVPSLEAVLKQVEEQCLKTYRIHQTDFSMLRIMKEVCECFWAAGTTSTYTEDVKPAIAMPSIGVSEDPSSDTGSAGSTDNQLSIFNESTISNVPVMNQNLLGVSPQIPRFVGSAQLDLSRCRIYLSVDISGSDEMQRKIMELSSCVPSSSRMMLAENQHNYHYIEDISKGHEAHEISSINEINEDRCPTFKDNVPSSSRMILSQKQHCYHYIEDITKGHEAHEISLINEINEEQGPTFNYISGILPYQNAYTRFLLARISEENCCSNCSGDCLSIEIPCACAVNTGGKFAYAPGGLVQEAFVHNFIPGNDIMQQHNLFYCQDCPVENSNCGNLSGKCKGHMVRKFIKECWYKCGCSMKCGNRVVQRGITAKLQVFMTPGQKGWGLRTLEDIPKGAFVCEYVGEVVTVKELFERNTQNTGHKPTYFVLLDADWSCKGVKKEEEALCLDATVYGNVARFINHRCYDADVVEIPVKIETPDRHYYHLAFFTTRKISAMEEITWDYGIDFDDSGPMQDFRCLCGSKFCRDRRSLKRKSMSDELW